MSRSIPPRGSVGNIDTTQLSGLTERQRAAIAQIQAWEEKRDRDYERELSYLDSVLEVEERLEAARILRRLSENSRTTGLWCFFGSIASGIEKGDSLLEVLSEVREQHQAEWRRK